MINIYYNKRNIELSCFHCNNSGPRNYSMISRCNCVRLLRFLLFKNTLVNNAEDLQERIREKCVSRTTTRNTTECFHEHGKMCKFMLLSCWESFSVTRVVYNKYSLV